MQHGDMNMELEHEAWAAAWKINMDVHHGHAALAEMDTCKI
jgi:hypothetical protein